MKTLTICLILMVGLVMTAPVVFARELEEVGETVWDSARGVNNSCPALLELGVGKTFEIEDKPFDVYTEISYTGDTHRLSDNNEIRYKAVLQF